MAFFFPALILWRSNKSISKLALYLNTLAIIILCRLGFTRRTVHLVVDSSSFQNVIFQSVNISVQYFCSSVAKRISGLAPFLNQSSTLIDGHLATVLIPDLSESIKTLRHYMLRHSL